MTDYRWVALFAWLPAILNYFCVMLFLAVAVLGERRRPPSARQSRQSYGIAAIVAYLCSLASAGTVLFCVYFGEPWLAVMLAGGSTFFLLSFILKGALARVAELGEEMEPQRSKDAGQGEQET